MIIYPDIEIQRGRCVNLYHGLMEQPTVYDISPLDLAKQYESEGAEVLHLVDLDNVMKGGHQNHKEICEIIKSVDIPVQVGGGIRSLEGAKWWFEQGAERIVLGTAAIEDSRFMHEVCQLYPERVLMSIDARGGYVMTHGWTHKTIYTPLQVGKELANSGVAEIIYTDIDFDDDHPEATFASTTEMAKSLAVPVISSGAVKTLDDISVLQFLPGIAGTVVGRALMRKQFTLPEALSISRQPQSNAKLI